MKWLLDFRKLNNFQFLEPKLLPNFRKLKRIQFLETKRLTNFRKMKNRHDCMPVLAFI